MQGALRCLAVTVLALALLPGAARAAATVNRAPDTGVITIVESDPPGDDDVRVVREPMVDVISRVSDSLTTSTAECAEVGNTVECPHATSFAVDLGDGNDRFRADNVPVPISVAGGTGNDDLATGSGHDVLAGGPGNDTLDGRAGTDEYFGETGDDIIEARDGAAERISCGQGADEARNDFVDIIAECERGVDADRDGFSSAVDCNDAAANISPGAAEVFDNGVDENCDGRDNPNLDVDRDGFARPLDCDDGNAAIRPTVPEIRGNAVDENCDRRAEPFAALGAVVSNQWAFAPAFARLRRLVVHNAPAGARIVFRCFGRSCPVKRARRRTAADVLKRVVLHRGFRKARLRPGTRLRVTITAPETIGRTYTYVVKRGAPPTSRIVCRAPGARRGRTC